MSINWYEMIGDCELLPDANMGNWKSGPLLANTDGIIWKTKRHPKLIGWSDITKIFATFDEGMGSVTVYSPRPTSFSSKRVSEPQGEVLKKIAEVTTQKTAQVKNEAKSVLDAYVLDGAGWAPPIGTLTSIHILESAIEFRMAQEIKLVEFNELDDVNIRGYSQTTNAGVIGGGFGIQGAAEGMLAARLVNQLTAKTKQWVVVQILGNSGSVQLFIADTSDVPIRHFFRPAQDGIIFARSSSSFQSPNSGPLEPSNDLVSSLERLTTLYEKDLLSDEEFLAAKAKLLGGE